ncbi:hypothetical protein [Dasania marina]|uniref:hypothetical protein n=1 Tax=Dasania marina TaxID=471499 RepID=UPI00035E317E|nr:hypothetical protein [Dasania marina]
MDNLIEALQIFMKYKNVKWPTNCSHDVLAIMDVEQSEVSKADTKRLDELDFFWSEEYDCFISFHYGSA